MSDHDVAVVGDGPAGSALARALVRRGVDAVLLGADQPWEATYTTWIDDLDGVDIVDGHDIWLHRFDSIGAHFDGAVTIQRAYGVLDNARLRELLRTDVRHRTGIVENASDVDARIVVDATGWPSGLDPTDRSGMDADPASMTWQTVLKSRANSR